MSRPLIGLRFKSALARLVLLAEYAARMLWAPLSIVSGFVFLAALDILPSLPPWVHAGTVAAFAIAFAACLRRGLRTNRVPSRIQMWRRMEQESAARHRPFDTLADRPAGRNGTAVALWEIHRDSAQMAMRSLRVGWPRASLTAHDSRAWRALAALALVVGVVVGSGDLWDRLDAALSPGVLGAMPARSIGYQAWITPPNYTGLPPVILSAAAEHSGDVLEVPAGSLVEAHVTGGSARPHLVIDGKRTKFQAADAHEFQVSTPLTGGTAVTITKGWRTLGSWPVSVSDVPAPVIAWVHPPATGDHEQIKLEYTAADIYGLASLNARIALADEVRGTMLPRGSALDRPEAAYFDVKLSDVSGHPKSVKSTTPEDWSANPWAGFPVMVTLTATGVSGQTSSTKPMPLVLPERKFNDPVARAIIAERKKLTLDPAAERIIAATSLAELAAHHELFHDDIAVYLALRAAASRLWTDEDLASMRDVSGILWKVAVLLEDGSNAEAAKSVADAEKALRSALDNNAPQSEIDRLTKALKQAMNEYMDKLAKDMQDKLAHGQPVPTVPPGMAGQMLSRKSLDDLVDRMNNLSQGGNRDAAKDLLSQLEQTMRNLRMAEKAGPNSKSMQAWSAMQQLRGLADKQQHLMDKTFRRSQGKGTQGDEMQSLERDQSDPTARQHGQAGDTGVGEQQTLKETLHGLQQQLEGLGAKMPREMQESESAMGAAKGKLGRQDFAGALPSQQEALDKLRQGLQSLSDQMGKGVSGLALGSDQHGGEPGGHQQEGKNDDPFGRSDDTLGNASDDGRVHVPDEGEQQRSREILQELRKRDGERFRPPEERGYLDRLLKDY